MKPTSEAESQTRNRLRRIEGRHNAALRDLRRAFTRAERTGQDECAIEGVRIVEEAIRSSLRFRAVFFRESALSQAERIVPQLGAHVETLLVPDRLFDAALPSETPQGVAALVRLKEFSLDDVMGRLHLGPVLIVVGLQDPGNLGTILRSAEAFGSAGVVPGEGSVSPFNSKAIRGSAGSVFRLPVVVAKNAGGMEAVSEAIRTRGVRRLATSSHKGIPVDQAKLAGPVAIFIGSEGAGVSRSLQAKADEMLAIPHSPQVESLNAGVAASIVLYEAARQRRLAAG